MNPELLPPNVQVLDSALDPALSSGKERVIRYKSVGGREHYRVWLYLAGPRLPFVDRATYILHPSFNPPVHEVARTPANPNCTLLVWTWGIFDVTVVLHGKKGETAELVHTMRYDKDFQSKGVSFAEVKASSAG